MPEPQEVVVEQPKVEQLSLDSILTDAPVKPERKAKAEKQVVEQVKEEKKEEPVKQEQKTEQKAEPAKHQEEFTAKERAFQAAAIDERRKRQVLEAKLAEYEAEKAKVPPKPFWDDPDGAITQLEQKFEQRWAAEKAQLQNVAVNTRLDTAEAIARSKHADFDEKVSVFTEILYQNPGLQNEWISSPDPAEFAYNIGKNRIELQQAGSLDALRQKIEAEVRLKVESEMKEKEKKADQERAALPGSLSNVKGGSQNKVEWSGPTALGDILGTG